MNILVTGASGLVGRRLIHQLLEKGRGVAALARHPDSLPELPARRVHPWRASEGIPPEALRDAGAIVHLAGENIAGGRWTSERKKILWDSRCGGTRHVVESLAALPEKQRPKVLIAASAIGFYGTTGDEAVDESDERGGQGFLADLVRAWEDEARAAESLGVRVVLLRTGVVLSRDGGALARMQPVILSAGRQWMSWIHIDDLVRFIERAIDDPQIRGPYNLTSPQPVRNEEFTRTFANALGYPVVLRTPAFVLRAALGEMSSLLLDSQRVRPTRLQNLGFDFRHADLAKALGDLYGQDDYLTRRISFAQFVPRERDEIFTFFSKAENLEKITPPQMGFHVRRKSTPEMRAGTEIDYGFRLYGVPLRWRARIKSWEAGHQFIDEQVSGPYRFWEHHHRFDSVPGGTLIRDDITYRTPGSVAGKALLGDRIEKDLRRLFAYRQETLRAVFSESTKPSEDQ